MESKSFIASELNHKYSTTWLRALDKAIGKNVNLFINSVGLDKGEVTIYAKQIVCVQGRYTSLDRTYPYDRLEFNFKLPRSKYIQLYDQAIMISRTSNRTFKKGFCLDFGMSISSEYATYSLYSPIGIDVVRKLYNVKDHVANPISLAAMMPTYYKKRCTFEDMDSIMEFAYSPEYSSYDGAVDKLRAGNYLSVPMEEDLCLALSSSSKYDYTIYKGLCNIAGIKTRGKTNFIYCPKQLTTEIENIIQQLGITESFISYAN